MSFDKVKKKLSSWRLEQSFHEATTLEELVNAPAFKDASDSSGQSHSVSTRVPTWLHRHIAHLCEMKGGPYYVHSDVMRDALYIGLRVLSMRYRLNPRFDAEVRMAKAVDKVGVAKRVRAQIAELANGLEEMTSNKDIVQAVEGLEDFVVPVLEIEDEWYKNKVIQLLMENRTVRTVLSNCSDNVQKSVDKIYKESMN